MYGLDKLRATYPWPDRRPVVNPSDFGFDGGGREMIVEVLRGMNIKVILEIGSFLGLSTRQWLEAAPSAQVICIDPWKDSDMGKWKLQRPELAGQMPYETFLASCWDYRDRIVPIRGRSPQAVEEVRAHGVPVDLIYVDGDHAYESVSKDIRSCHACFPEAILTGDDWSWDKTLVPPRSVREAVEDFAAELGLPTKALHNTWLLASRRYRWNFGLRLYQTKRWLISCARQSISRTGS